MSPKIIKESCQNLIMKKKSFFYFILWVRLWSLGRECFQEISFSFFYLVISHIIWLVGVFLVYI